jgi:hypothetical protein
MTGRSRPASADAVEIADGAGREFRGVEAGDKDRLDGRNQGGILQDALFLFPLGVERLTRLFCRLRRFADGDEAQRQRFGVLTADPDWLIETIRLRPFQLLDKIERAAIGILPAGAIPFIPAKMYPHIFSR